MKEPENIYLGRGRNGDQTSTESHHVVTDSPNNANDNNNDDDDDIKNDNNGFSSGNSNHNTKVNNNNNNQKLDKNNFGSKHDQRRKSEIPEVKNPDNAGVGAGVYYVSYGKTTEPFNFGSGPEVRDEDDDQVMKRVEI